MALSRAHAATSVQGMHADVGVSLIVPAVASLLYMLCAVIQPRPCFAPQYAVPLWA